MQIDFVDLKAQYASIVRGVDDATHGVVASADFSLGKQVDLFEQEFAAYCAAGLGIGVDSEASAIELAVRAYDIGAGDEVITVSHTFSATAFASFLTAAQPVFIDVNLRSYNPVPA